MYRNSLAPFSHGKGDYQLHTPTMYAVRRTPMIRGPHGICLILMANSVRFA